MAESSLSLENHKIMQIPYSVTKGGYYEVKIENVYDPSKFWIIIKFRELAIFMKYLKYFYDSTENRKVLPRSNFKKNLMCMVLRSDMYYRSMILPVLLPDKNFVRVFMIDFGYIVNVSVDSIFHICEKHCSIPRFAIRASLAYISPAVTDQSNTWSQTDLKNFCGILGEKKIYARVCEIDSKRNILFTELYVLYGVITKSVSNILINLNSAVQNTFHRNIDIGLMKYNSKLKYPHLFPSFEALEGGTVPCSLWEYDLLKDSVPLDLLYKNYYEYQA